MNIVNLHNNSPTLPGVSRALFDRMEHSLKSAGANFEQSVRTAKTIAPILQDQSSNSRHLEVIRSSATIQEKVIAILMLGFPKNRQVLPVLKDLLLNSSDSLAIASSIAIAQMADGHNNDLLTDILVAGFHNTNSGAVKKTIRQSIVGLMDKKSAKLVNELFREGA